MSTALSGANSEIESPTATFAIQDLGVLPGGTSSRADAINNAGDAAGSGDVGATVSASHAILWTGTSATDLGVPFGDRAGALGINDARSVVGWSTDNRTGVQIGWIWRAGVFTLRGSYVADINNNEEIVGADPVGVFREKLGGPVQYLPAPANFGVGVDAISDQGIVVGWITLGIGVGTHAVMWSASNVFTDLGTLGGLFGEAKAVNNLGAVVGFSSTSNGMYEPFFWSSASGMLSAPFWGVALGISDRGRMVGYPSTGPTVGITKRGKGRLVPLPLLPGGAISDASDVNTCGTIVGAAANAAGAYHAVRWLIGRCD